MVATQTLEMSKMSVFAQARNYQPPKLGELASKVILFLGSFHVGRISQRMEIEH